MLENGLIQVYTGKSMKYNFAPVGLSLRAAGQGLRTLMACFVPHELMDDEAQMVSFYLNPYLTVDHTAIEGVHPRGVLDRDKTLRLFHKASQAVLASAYDIVILNGISQTMALGIINVDDVLTLMRAKPSNVELVLTGPGVPQAVIDKADLVTELELHPIATGQKDGDVPINQGSIEVVTGNGKGKTTYCLGKSMLYSSIGIRCAFLQFIKSPQPYGEVKAIKMFPNIDIKTMGEGFLGYHPHGHEKRHIEAARRAWEKCLREVFSLKYGLIVMDELNTATFHGLVNPDRVRELLFLKPQNLHLMLSGRNAHAEVMAAASAVIEMKEVKHPYRKGIRARMGIEF
ncbi:MAG: cob(I)yrinic acid a,c-diamide adenosyltransferase [Deltaproteobacteria bacterium]|nr:cob(I)yrinic acid a,c-diamide adenosyltransferase [Deltaproteobacteria bacterium]